MAVKMLTVYSPSCILYVLDRPMLLKCSTRRNGKRHILEDRLTLSFRCTWNIELSGSTFWNAARKRTVMGRCRLPRLSILSIGRSRGF